MSDKAEKNVSAPRSRPKRRAVVETKQVPVVCSRAPRNCADLAGLPGILSIDRKGGKVVEVQFDPADPAVDSASIYPVAFKTDDSTVALVGGDGRWCFEIDFDGADDADGDESASFDGPPGNDDEGDDTIDAEIVDESPAKGRIKGIRERRPPAKTAKPPSLRLLPTLTDDT